MAGLAVDTVLALLVTEVDISGIEIGITFTVGGSTFAGQMVSTEKYMKSMAAEFRRLGEIGEPLAEIFERDSKEAPVKLPEFIHIKNFKKLESDATWTEFTDTYWRGRISDIQGFVVGIIEF